VVVPFARIAPDRWVARVQQRGRLAAVDEPPGGRRGRARAVRVLATADAVPAGSALASGPVERTENGPFGLRTRTVRLPLADVPLGWLRTSTHAAGREHLEAEQALFQAAERRVPGSTPRCLGHDSHGGGYLYAPPLALSAEVSAPLRAWAADEPLAFAAAAARLWRTLRDAGLALGFYHTSALAFRVRMGPASAPARALHAVATAAPLGTSLGAPYRRSREALSLFPPFERLGGTRLPPAQMEGGTALPATEAAAAALYVLNLLAMHPLPLPSGAPWDEFADMLMEAPRNAFLLPQLAEKLARGLAAPDELTRVLEMLATEARPAAAPEIPSDAPEVT
jgi:hypothetical protein